MAKKKKPEFDADLQVTPDGLLSQAIELQVSKLGRADTIIGGESVIGLTLPALSLRILLGNNVWPLSRMCELTGIPASGKTALLSEIFHWFLLWSGGYQLNLTEARDTPDLRSSIIGREHEKRFPLIKCGSIEQYQAATTKRIQLCEKTFSRTGAMAWPLCIGVDSLCGVLTNKSIEGIVAEGFATSDFARAPALIRDWLQAILIMIRPWPVSLVLLNHLKEEKDKQGRTIRRVLGGTQVGHSATFILRGKRMGEYEYTDNNARLLEIIHDKNSLSSAGAARRVKVYMRWRYDELGRQVTWFDWHDASIEYLLGIEVMSLKSRVADVMTLEDVDVTRRKASCPELGLKKAKYADIGLAIEDPQNSKIRVELDKIFHVVPRRTFQTGVPYCVQQAEAIAAGDVLYEGQSIVQPLDGQQDDEEVEDVAG